MKPIRGLDPPEYVGWREDPEIVEEFDARIRADDERAGIIGALPAEARLRLYRGLVRNRMHDLQMKRWVRSGVLSKAWLGTGEEATTVGACHALEARDVVGPMIRNIGACHERGMPLVEMFRGALGAGDGPTGGRDIHFGDLERGIVAPISMVGALAPVCAGMALAYRLRGEDRAALTWAGDGTIRTAAFQEGMACAAKLRVPLVVVVQDNQIALGTPTGENASAEMEALASVFSAPGASVDGNHVLDVYAGVRVARRKCRGEAGPAFVFARTFRMGGHATHDEGESRKLLPEAKFAFFGKRDPVRLYRAWLLRVGLAGTDDPERALSGVEAEVEIEVETAAREALASRERPRPTVDARSVAAGVFA